jgi:hypothetical protein
MFVPRGEGVTGGWENPPRPSGATTSVEDELSTHMDITLKATIW